MKDINQIIQERRAEKVRFLGMLGLVMIFSLALALSL